MVKYVIYNFEQLDGELCGNLKGWAGVYQKNSGLARIGLAGHYISSWIEMNIDHVQSPVIVTGSEQSCQMTELLWIPIIPSLWSCQQAGEQITLFHASPNSD